MIYVVKMLETDGFEAFVVGGCVRDLLLGKIPKDWDVTTNATPEQVQKIFPESVYENEFGTVGIKAETEKGKTEVIEVTTYRIESKYSDKRHPDRIKFAKTLQEDLSRRDFTVNAMALKVWSDEEQIIDPFKGQNDLENAMIRAVGNPKERFDEDALRMMRAIRFAVELDFLIDQETFQAIKDRSQNLGRVSKERIRDEFSKIILSPAPAKGVNLLVETALMKHVIPQIYQAVGVKQNRHHYHGPFNTVFKHSVASLEKCPSDKLSVRLAAFLHDIGKPKTKEGEGEMATFHAHEYAGAKLTEQIMQQLKYPRKIIEKTVLLVKNHMFYYNVDEVGEAGVRRVIRKVGLENINDLIDVRIADRLGSGVPKAVPYKLRHFKYMVEKVSNDPISVGQLKLKGDQLMSELELKPGPKIGAILEVLLAKVIDDPSLNERKLLIAEAKKLQKQDLEKLRAMAREKITKEQKKADKRTKDKYWVK